MFSYLWNTLLYEPLLNALAFIISILPGGDVGIAVIVLTIIVKLVLLPLSGASIKSQAKMTLLAPELDKIKKSGVRQENKPDSPSNYIKSIKLTLFPGVY